MKVNLRGLFSNVANSTPSHVRSYHKACLDEVLAHIQGVIDGQYTLKEFAEHYCMRPRENPEPETVNEEATQ